MKTDRPKVSVIIPVYNVEDYLRECLDSVINQTLKDLEIICINDGSTDNSLEILKEYTLKDSRIKIIDKKNEGVAQTRNRGIKIAKGDFVCFIDPDDIYPANDILGSLYTRAIEHNVNICGGEFADYNTNTKEITQDFPLDEYDGYLFDKDGIIEYKDYQFDYGYHRFIYNRRFLLKNNIFYPKYKRFQDPPFFVKAMIKAKEFYAIDKITYGYRWGHQETNWDYEKTCDLLKGLLKNLHYAKKYKLEKLTEYSYKRLLYHYPKIKEYMNFNTTLLLNIMMYYNSYQN